MHAIIKKTRHLFEIAGFFVSINILRFKGSDVVPHFRFVSGGRIAVDNAFFGCFINYGLRAIDQCFCFFSAICSQYFFDGSTQIRACTFVAEPDSFSLAHAFF